jgi:hypothetical protein
MGLRELVKQTTGIGNAYALGALNGEIYMTFRF